MNTAWLSIPVINDPIEIGIFEVIRPSKLFPPPPNDIVSMYPWLDIDKCCKKMFSLRHGSRNSLFYGTRPSMVLKGWNTTKMILRLTFRNHLSIASTWTVLCLSAKAAVPNLITMQ